MGKPIHISSNYKNLFFFIIWFLPFMFCTSLFSQNEIQERSLYMSQIGINEGLTAGGINSIAEDNEGYLWLATPDGLNRYDGHRIKKYVNDPENPNSLLSSYVNKVFVDSRGWIWVKTRLGGLHIYNKKRNNFLRIPVKKLQTKSFEDYNGDIWCQSDQGYNIIRINQEFNDTYSSDLTLDDVTIQAQEEVYSNLPKNMVSRKMTFSKNNGLWIYSSNTLFNYKLNKNKRNAELLSKTVLEHIEDVQLVINPNNDEILISSKSKLLIFDGLHKKILDSINIPKEVSGPKSVELIDHKNRLWIFVNGFVYRVNLDTKIWEKISLQAEGSRKEQLKYAINLSQDSHNNLWFGTKGFGVFKHSVINEAFNYFGKDRAGPLVHTILGYDDDSVIFSATDEEPVMQVLNYENNTLKDVFLPEAVFSPLKESSFNVFFKDSKERYWVPSKEVNGKGFKMLILDKNLELLHEIESPLYNNNKEKALITYVFETEDGQTWGVGTLNNENEVQEYPHVYLSKWSEKNKQFFVESVFKDHPKDYDFNQCTSSIQTSDGCLWFGFQTGGLLKYNPDRKVWKHFFKGDIPNGKPSYNIFSLSKSLENSKTNFWLGSRSGLIDFNSKNETFNIYNEKNGLTNNVVYGVLADDKNNLWMSTNNGICRFNPVNGLLTNFSINDGIQGLEFNRRAYFKRKDGTLFFGGVGGLSWFHPKDLETSLDIAKIEINGLKLSNKRADSLLLDTQDIQFPYHQKLITFEFSKLNLTAPSRIKYTYRLDKDGNEDDWTEIGNQPSITFTELSPGDYTFHISTYNTDGSISTQQDSITFSIAEPWWCNDWLKLLAVIIIGAIGYYLYFVKIKSRLKLEKLKNTISRDLHDEIGSTLSSIALYGTIAEKELITDPKKAKKLLQKINSYSSSSIEAMNDIVWAIKPGNETIEQLINRIRFYCNEIESTGNWKILIEHDSKLLATNLDMIKMRNLFLIIKEAINNAIKHSQGNQIEISFLSFQGNNMIVVEVEDNGVGFDFKSNNFERRNGITNMQQRTDELNGSLEFMSSKTKGVKIKLVFYNM